MDEKLDCDGLNVVSAPRGDCDQSLRDHGMTRPFGRRKGQGTEVPIRRKKAQMARKSRSPSQLIKMGGC